MRSHIFPIKLHSLMSALHNTQMLENRKAPPGITEEQEDGLERIMLISSEVHHATGHYLEIDSTTLRKRLAFPPRGSALTTLADQTLFEVYDVEGKLVHSTQVRLLQGAMSLAVEVELMSLILEGNGVKIEMM